MATKFCETPQATYGTQFWDAISGSVTRDTTAARDPLGLSSWKCDSGAGNAAATVAKYSILPNSSDSGGRFSFYLYLVALPSATVCLTRSQVLGDLNIRLTSEGILQLWSYTTSQVGSNGSTLSTGTLYRISLAYKFTGASLTDANLFVHGNQDISITGQSLNIYPHLYIGWVEAPGANKVLNFSHVYMDNDTSLTDPVGSGYGLYVTAKLPAAVNNKQYTTTEGTGAVNERPLSETNYKAETGKTAYLQDYTLQAAGVGDVDLTAVGITLIARDAWMWYKTSSMKNPGSQSLVDNGGLVACDETTTPTLFNYITDSATYPSNAAGIGQKSTGTADNTYLYECGTLIAYKVAAPPAGIRTEVMVY